MARTKLYPEGSAQLNVIVPQPLKETLRRIAREHRQSISQLATLIIEDYLHRRGLNAASDKNP